MGHFHHALRLVESLEGPVPLRRIARSLGAEGTRDTASLVRALFRAADGDFSKIVSATGGPSLRAWNTIVVALGGAARPTRRAIADELLVLAASRAAEPGSLACAADDEELALTGALPEGAFDLDPEAATSPPREYQRELVEELERVLAASPPGRSYRIMVATGGGKTRVANDWMAGVLRRPAAEVLGCKPGEPLWRLRHDRGSSA